MSTYTQPLGYNANWRYNQPGLGYNGPVITRPPADAGAFQQVGPLRVWKRVKTSKEMR